MGFITDVFPEDVFPEFYIYIYIYVYMFPLHHSGKFSEVNGPYSTISAISAISAMLKDHSVRGCQATWGCEFEVTTPQHRRVPSLRSSNGGPKKS